MHRYGLRDPSFGAIDLTRNQFNRYFISQTGCTGLYRETGVIIRFLTTINIICLMPLKST